MFQTVRFLPWAMIVLTVCACASSVPPSRLAQYVGPRATIEQATLPSLPPRSARAGLVLITDRTAPDAAPGLPDEAVNRLADTLQRDLNGALPLVIERVIPSESIGLPASSEQWRDIGKQQGLDYLMVLVASSTEQEYPLTIFLGWTTHSQPGLRRDNWSLLEAALVDLKTGETVLRAEGRGWATLDRPMAPGINQWYPVIWLRPQDPARRIWPPTYEGAPTTLRVVAMNQAATRLILTFQEAWIVKRERELQMAHEPSSETTARSFL